MLSVLAEAKNPVIDNFDMAKSGMDLNKKRKLIRRNDYYSIIKIKDKYQCPKFEFCKN